MVYVRDDFGTMRVEDSDRSQYQSKSIRVSGMDLCWQTIIE